MQRLTNNRQKFNPKLMEIILKDRKYPDPLVQILRDAQELLGYLSADTQKFIAEKMELPLSHVHGVVSFFHFFHSEPVGKNVIYLSNNITSKIERFKEVRETFEKECNTKFGEGPDPTGTFSLFEVSCIGLSDHPLPALINLWPFIYLTPEKVKNIVAQLRNGAFPKELSDEVVDNVHYYPLEHSIIFRDFQAGNALHKLFQKKPAEVIDDIRDSKLSGRGGAFYETYKKWTYTSQANSDIKYIICNADEGEPGTFKDRMLLNQYPGLILEGMITTGYATGASQGYLYLRAEYLYLEGQIRNEIKKYYEKGLLGKNILGSGFDFDIAVFVGAGAYICGEETALIESMEGNRGIPRNKPPFPGVEGLWHKPTVVNNVETLAYAARLIELGLDEYLNKRGEKQGETKILSVSGNCDKPGIYEIKWGMTIRDLLNLCEAKNPKVVQLNGPSGILIGEVDFDDTYLAPDDYPLEKLPGATKESKKLLALGSVMIFDKTVSIVDIVTNFIEFFSEESCGKCTPCRVGLKEMERILRKITNCRCGLEDLNKLEELGNVVKELSFCGLGKTAPNTVLSSIKYFRQEYVDYINGK